MKKKLFGFGLLLILILCCAYSAMASSLLPAPELKQGPMGIEVRLPKNVSNKNNWQIDCTNNRGERDTLYCGAKQKSYLYTDLDMNCNYSFSYRLYQNDGTVRESRTNTITYTKYSQISNLQVTLDSDDARTFRVRWDDEYKAEYDVNIKIADSDDRGENWHWSGLPINSNRFVFRKAVPDTEYTVTVTAPITGQQLIAYVYVPQAPDYTSYGASGSGGLFWIPDAQYDNYNWNVTPQTDYHTLSLTDFNQKSKNHHLVAMARADYSRKNPAQDIEVLTVVRAPDGWMDYTEWILDKPSNRSWQASYSPINWILSRFGSGYADAAGTYIVDIYWNGKRVTDFRFRITN